MGLIASSKACLSLIGRFERINIWSASIDKLTSSSKLIPGIGRFESRYKISNNKKPKKKKKDSKKKSSSNSTTDIQSQTIEENIEKLTASKDKMTLLQNEESANHQTE